MSLLDAVSTALNDAARHDLPVDRIRIDPTVTQNRIVMQPIGGDAGPPRLEIRLHPADWNAFLTIERLRMEALTSSFDASDSGGSGVDRLLGVPIYREAPRRYRFVEREISNRGYSRGGSGVIRFPDDAVR